MKLCEQIAVLSNYDRMKIYKDNAAVYTGYAAYVNGTVEDVSLQQYGLTGEEEVKKFKFELEIRHKKWKELGLLEPTNKDQIAQYIFKDLQMDIYCSIYT